MYVRFRYSWKNPMRFAVFLVYFCAVLRFSDPPYAPLLHVLVWFLYHFNRIGNRSYNKPSVKMIPLLYSCNDNTASLELAQWTSPANATSIDVIWFWFDRFVRYWKTSFFYWLRLWKTLSIYLPPDWQWWTESSCTVHYSATPNHIP